MKPLAILALLILAACAQPTEPIDIAPTDLGPMQGDVPYVERDKLR